MASVQVIPTLFDGHHYRSRLEARYAVLFRELGIEFLYEPEAFRTGKSGYIPDFFLPHIKFFAEVKPGNFNPEELAKAQCLAQATGRPVLKLIGEPAAKNYAAIHFIPFDDGSFDFEDHVYLLDIFWHENQRYYRNGRLYCLTDVEQSRMVAPEAYSDEFRQAVHAARVARFGPEGKW